MIRMVLAGSVIAGIAWFSPLHTQTPAQRVQALNNMPTQLGAAGVANLAAGTLVALPSDMVLREAARAVSR
jgi:hypothetical protein